MEEKKIVAKAAPPAKVAKKVKKNWSVKMQPYLYLIPIAIMILVVLSLMSAPFSQLAMTVVICLTIIVLAAMVGILIYTLLGGNEPKAAPLTPQQQRSQWLVDQSVRIAESIRTRSTETTKPDGTVIREVDGLPDAEREKLMAILEKSLTDVQEDDLELSTPPPPPQPDLEKLELDDSMYEDDWPFN